MYDPYENKNDMEKNGQAQAPANTEGQKPVTPNYGYTSTPGASTSGTGTPGTTQTVGSVTYHTGPVTAGQAYLPRQNTPPVQQPAAYSWNQPTPPQPTVPYYGPVQPPKPKKKKKGGRFALKLLAAVLCCAVVSMGSVCVFAMMIQNGVVNVESRGESNKTAAFTIYKQAESDKNATPTVTGETMTAQEAAKKVTPSVVCVQNYQITQQGGFYWGYGYGEEEEGGLSPAGEGSGIIISKDGYIVTNQHVVAGATSLKVVTSEGLTYEAELVGEDTQTDLAVIKVTTEDELTPAEFGSSEDLEVGDEVLAIGNPGGLQLNSSVTFGRVSALNRKVENSETGYSMACVQTDAAINPGNSGGALVDLEGHVVGINSSKIVATGYEGLGFAIPSDTAQPIVSDLIEHGYVKDRPAIGFDGQYVDRLTASFFGMNAGYYVTEVTSAEAQQAGLQRGDMVVAIDDTQITSEATIPAYIVEKKPGDTVTLTLERNGRQGTLELPLAENTGRSGGTTMQGTWE